MANVLNFNRYRPPILPMVMPDEAQTVLNLSPPTVDLQEELRSNLHHLQVLLSKEDDDMVAALYDLAARLMSCNRNLKHVTADDLRTTYKMDVEDLVVFYHSYAEYLQEIENAKN